MIKNFLRKIQIITLLPIVGYILGTSCSRSSRFYERDSIVYVESIQITDPDNGAAGLVVKEPDLETEDYYFFVRFETDLTVRVEANINPRNATYSKIKYSWDFEQDVFDLKVENNNIANIHFYKKSAARFVAESIDGKGVQSRILIIAR